MTPDVSEHALLWGMMRTRQINRPRSGDPFAADAGETFDTYGAEVTPTKTKQPQRDDRAAMGVLRQGELKIIHQSFEIND